MTSRATGTEILGKRALTLKDTRIVSGLSFCAFRDSANPLLSLTNEKLFTQYH